MVPVAVPENRPPSFCGSERWGKERKGSRDYEGRRSNGRGCRPYPTLPFGGFHSLCIEFKTPSKSSRQTPTQKEWQALAEAHGNKYIVCRSLEDFQQVIRAYIPRLCW